MVKASYACYYAEIAILAGLLLYKFMWWDVRFFYFVALLVAYFGLSAFHYAFVWWATNRKKSIESHHMRVFPKVFFFMPFLVILCVSVFEFLSSPLTDICEPFPISETADLNHARLQNSVRLSSHEALHVYVLPTRDVWFGGKAYNITDKRIEYENTKTKQRFILPILCSAFNVEKGLFRGYSISYKQQLAGDKWIGFLHMKNGEITQWCYET